MSQYDAIAHQFSQSRQHAWPEFNLFTPLIDVHKRLLDIGCGNGRLRSFVPDSVDYVGMDLSEKLLNIAKEAHPTDMFIQHDFTHPWPFESEHFGGIIGIASVHHALTTTAVQHVFDEAFRVLQPGGFFGCTTWRLPDKHRWSNWLRGRFCVWNIPFQGQPRWYRRISNEQLKTYAQRAGFDVEQRGIVREKNHYIIARKPS